MSSNDILRIAINFKCGVVLILVIEIGIGIRLFEKREYSSQLLLTSIQSSLINPHYGLALMWLLRKHHFANAIYISGHIDELHQYLISHFCQ